MKWTERITAIIEQEKNKKAELDKFEDWLKAELKEINTPCAFFKDLLAKICLDKSIPEHYKRDMSNIIEKYLSQNKCT